MKKYVHIALIAVNVLLAGCKQEKSDDKMKFGTHADYPPFEYYVDGKMTGFDIELAKLIATELGKEAVFEDMKFCTILPALDNGIVDAGISGFTVTKERMQNYDFTESYYEESLATIYKKNKPFTEKAQLSNAKIGCQLGTTMEIWLKNNLLNAEIVTMDCNNQLIEALKAGHVECVFIDTIQGKTYCKENPGLAYSEIAKSGNGYAIVVKKGSPLKDKINAALKSLESKGEIQKLKQKWLQ